jgi:hypothetical protein
MSTIAVPMEISLGLRLPCWLCGDACHMVADTRLDLWDWADDSGSKTGKDSDLRQLYDAGWTPYGRLKWLADEMERLHKLSRKTKDGYHWPDDRTRAEYHARGREYSALKVRLEFGGTFHIHHVRTDSVPPWKGELPYCCGSPAWLRPSGWHCRECRAVLG